MRRNLKIILTAEAIALLVFCALGYAFESSFASVMAFPFEQLGSALRTLSLSGAAGNVVAILIYCISCLLPVMYLIFRAKKGRARAEDGLLALLGAVLFAVVYLMVNPADIARHFGSFELLDANKALLGVTVYSIAAGYLILWALRLFANSETGCILRYMKLIMAAVCVLLDYGIFGSGLMELIAAFRQLSEGNTGGGQNLGLSYVFLVLQYLVKILPFALEIAVVFAGLELVEALEKDPYGREVAMSARKTGRVCRISIVAIMLSQIAVNVLQLALGSLVRASHYTLSIPILSVVFVLAAMLLAGYFEKARRLKDDNDMFI